MWKESLDIFASVIGMHRRESAGKGELPTMRMTAQHKRGTFGQEVDNVRFVP